MQALELRDEFLSKHMRGTAIELRNKQNTGWAQKGPVDLLAITYPTSDVQRSLEAVSAATPGKPIVFLGQRGCGKSHIMALLHHAIESPDAVMQWSAEWGVKLSADKPSQLKLQTGFLPISETLSNQEYPNIWELIFDRHPNGAYHKGKFEQSGTDIPAKSILQDLFAEKPTTLVLDEFQTWFDGLTDTPGDAGPKRRQWAFNFTQILSELSKERPDLFMFVVSVRDNTTEAFKQIHRDGPVVIDFKGETAKDDRKRLLLHRLFKNRDHFSDGDIEQIVGTYASERNRLLYADRNSADQSRLWRDVVETWPYSPELIALLEDNIMMADAAQETRDLIRVLAEVFRARGHEVPVVTAADFQIDDDECGVITLLDSFSTAADQEQLRDRAQRNLDAIKEAAIDAPDAREVISGIWMRSLSPVRTLGAEKSDLQLDITRSAPVDDNAFTAELAAIVDASFNIHQVGVEPRRHCFKLPENPGAKVKAWARNDRHFEPETVIAPGLLAVGRDQEFLRITLEHLLRPEVTEPPSRVIVLDPNWNTAPWANVQQQDQPERWDRQVLLVLPEAPTDVQETLGPWLAAHVSKNRNMVRFLLSRADSTSLFDDLDLIILARCALLAKEWMGAESQYKDLHTRFNRDLRKELSERFDRYAILSSWDYQNPKACKFHVETHRSTGREIPAAVEKDIWDNFFAPEDFEAFITEASKRTETMTRVLSLLRDPSPGDTLIPYLGDQALYERVLRVVADDKIAINRNSEWYCRDAGQSFEEALRMLEQRAMPTGWDWNSIYLGTPSEAGGAGVTAPTAPTTQPSTDTTPVGPPSTGTPTITTRRDRGPNAHPIIRQSLGSKTGINLLGDLEKWALPDKQKVMHTTLTFQGLSIKEVRDLCTKLPPKVQGELKITLPPDEEQSS